MSSASLPAGGGNADLPPDERLKGDVKLALLQNLKTQLLTDAARTHKLLTEKKEALARQLNPFVPSGDRASSKPRKVVVCVCVPEQVEQVVTFSTELDGAIPIFFHSYHPARKFMSREQPWFKTQPFQLLVYAPLQVAVFDVGVQMCCVGPCYPIPMASFERFGLTPWMRFAFVVTFVAFCQHE